MASSLRSGSLPLKLNVKIRAEILKHKMENWEKCSDIKQLIDLNLLPQF
jgi:hypothetical protein